MDGFNGIVITIGDKDFPIQISVLVWISLAVIMSIVFIIAGRKIRKADPSKVSKGLVYLAEFYYLMIKEIITDTSGKRNRNLIPYIGTLFLMMIISNVIGLLGLQPPTSNLGINATFALITFFLIHYNGIKTNGLSHFKGLFEPFVFMFPMNVFGELAIPISLSVRLFANILSGLFIMTMVYAVIMMLNTFAGGLFGIGTIVNIGINPLLHGFFDVFVGILQAYVFMVLTLFFIGAANDSEEAELAE